MRVLALSEHPSAALYAMAKALGETTIACFCPPDVARNLIPSQADRVLCFWDDIMQQTDYVGRAVVCSQIVRHVQEKFGKTDAILVRDPDMDLGPALAERLELLHLGHVTSAHAVAEAGSTLMIERRVGCIEERLRVNAPVLLCVMTPDPADGKTHAFEGEIERLTLDDLGVGRSELGWRRHFCPAPSEGAPVPQPRAITAEALCARGLTEGWFVDKAPARPGNGSDGDASKSNGSGGDASNGKGNGGTGA
jgi:hypothetical protein